MESLGTMGFLEKRNPRATRTTVIRAAILGAAGFFLFALIMLFRTNIAPWGWVSLMLSFMTVFGAISGAALEWQLPEDLHDDEAETVAPPDGGDSLP